MFFWTLLGDGIRSLTFGDGSVRHGFGGGIIPAIVFYLPLGLFSPAPAHSQDIWEAVQNHTGKEALQLQLAGRVVSEKSDVEMRVRAAEKLEGLMTGLHEEAQMALLDAVRLKRTPPAVRRAISQLPAFSISDESNQLEIMNWISSEKAQSRKIEPALSSAVRGFQNPSQKVQIKFIEWLLSAETTYRDPMMTASIIPLISNPGEEAQMALLDAVRLERTPPAVRRAISQRPAFFSISDESNQLEILNWMSSEKAQSRKIEPALLSAVWGFQNPSQKVQIKFIEWLLSAETAYSDPWKNHRHSRMMTALIISLISTPDTLMLLKLAELAVSPKKAHQPFRKSALDIVEKNAESLNNEIQMTLLEGLHRGDFSKRHKERLVGIFDKIPHISQDAQSLLLDEALLSKSDDPDPDLTAGEALTVIGLTIAGAIGGGYVGYNSDYPVSSLIPAGILTVVGGGFSFIAGSVIIGARKIIINECRKQFSQTKETFLQENEGY